MEFFNRKLNECSRQTVLPDVLWEGRPELLPYLLVNANMAAWLVVFVLFVVIMREPMVQLIAGGCCLLVLLGGLLRWVTTRYTITRQGCFTTDWRRCYWLGWNELLPTDYRVIQHPLEKLFGCCTIVYGVYPMRAALRGPWRHKAIFWCVRDHDLPRQLIESIFNQYA